MPQVSKRFLNQKTQDKIFNLFTSSFVMCNSKGLAVSLIEDLFTPTERIMLSKRFSIAYMLLKGYDYDSISQMLKVSRTTIGSVSLWLKEKGHGLRRIIVKIRRNESMRKVLEEIQDAFEELIASSPGQSWSRSKRELWLRRQSRAKPF